MKQPSNLKRRLAWILWIVIVAAMLTGGMKAWKVRLGLENSSAEIRKP
jgi:hypothetical protein